MKTNFNLTETQFFLQAIRYLRFVQTIVRDPIIFLYSYETTKFLLNKLSLNIPPA